MLQIRGGAVVGIYIICDTYNRHLFPFFGGGGVVTEVTDQRRKLQWVLLQRGGEVVGIYIMYDYI